MTNAILGVAAVLVLVILVLIFRLQGLIAVLRGSHKNKGGLTNKVNAAMFMVFFVVGLIGFLWYTFTGEYNLPEAVSEHGKRTDKLFLVTMIVICIVFVLTNFLLFVFAFKYQYKKENKATFFPENSKLEIIWTVIPAIVLTYLVFNGWKEWTSITTPPNEAQYASMKPVELEIVGQQFYWNCRYPGQDDKLGQHYFKRIDSDNQFGLKLEDKSGLDDFMPREIHLPVGRKVHFRIRAKDVLHSVFAPHFRLKMDAVPGMPTEFWFTPTKTTKQMRTELAKEARYQELDDQGQQKWKSFQYEIACTEVCGRGHFSMRYIIVVEEEEEYQKWYDSQKPWTVGARDYVANYLKMNNPELMKEYIDYIDEELTPKSEEAVAEVEETEVDAIDESPIEGEEIESEEIDEESDEDLSASVD